MTKCVFVIHLLLSGVHYPPTISLSVTLSRPPVQGGREDMPHMEEHDILFQFPHSAAAGERDFGPRKACKLEMARAQMWKLNSEAGWTEDRVGTMCHATPAVHLARLSS